MQRREASEVKSQDGKAYPNGQVLAWSQNVSPESVKRHYGVEAATASGRSTQKSGRFRTVKSIGVIGRACWGQGK